jgi:hypothetical protein
MRENGRVSVTSNLKVGDVVDSLCPLEFEGSLELQLMNALEKWQEVSKLDSVIAKRMDE